MLIILGSVLTLSGCASLGTSSDANNGKYYSGSTDYSPGTIGRIYKIKKTGQIIHRYGDSNDPEVSRLQRYYVNCKKKADFIFRNKSWDVDGTQREVEGCMGQSGYERMN